MSITRPFTPAANSVPIAVGAASASAKLADTSGLTQLRIFNEGTATAWVKFGGATVAASTATDYPVPAGSVEVITIPSYLSGPIYVAAIAAAATGNIWFTLGMGV